MMAILLLALLSSARPRSGDTPRYLVFGTKQLGWILVEAQSGQAEPLQFPPPFLPERVAISYNGGDVVFTAFDASVKNVLLFQWNRDNGTHPRRIGDDRGYHADPTISNDAQWVYFAHNPLAGGPPGQHERKAYAQLYRVRIDGGELEALTDESGCHFAPTNATSEQLIYVYSACTGDRTLRRLGLPALKATSLTKTGFIFNEPSVSADSRRLVFSSPNVDSVSISEIDLRTSQSWTAFQIDGASLPVRPQYGTSHRAIFYQAHGAIWRRDRDQSHRIASFTGEP